MMLLYFLYDDLVIYVVVFYLTSYVDWNRHTAVRLRLKTIVTSKQRFLSLDVFREEGAHTDRSAWGQKVETRQGAYNKEPQRQESKHNFLRRNIVNTA